MQLRVGSAMKQTLYRMIVTLSAIAAVAIAGGASLNGF
jgi:hypothetical protein